MSRRVAFPLEPPLDWPIRPSARLLAAVLGVHALFLLPALWLAVRIPWGWPLALLPFVAAAVAWRRLRLRAPGSVVRMVWEGGDDWRWYRADGSVRHGRLAAGGVRLPWLVAVRLRATGARRGETVLLAADSVGGNAFRRLRARLRLSR